MSKLSSSMFVILLAASSAASAQVADNNNYNAGAPAAGTRTAPVDQGSGYHSSQGASQNQVNQDFSVPNNQRSAAPQTPQGNAQQGFGGNMQQGSAGTLEQGAAGTVQQEALNPYRDRNATGYGSQTGVPAECRTASVHCPVTESSGSSVISTDSLPLGSTTTSPVGADRTVTESQYPTSVGSGSVGSGTTGTPAGPAPGPINGLGR